MERKSSSHKNFLIERDIFEIKKFVEKGGIIPTKLPILLKMNTMDHDLEHAEQKVFINRE